MTPWPASARRLLAVAALAVAVLAVAGCETGGGTVSPRADKPAAAAAAAATLGHAITFSGRRSGAKITVTAVEVVDNAQGVDKFTTPDPDKRFVAVRFRITNSGAVPYDDSPSKRAKAVDTAGQQFDADIVTVTTAGPSLPSDTTIAPGQSASGFLTFQLPTGSTLAAVRFATDSGSGSTGQWAASGVLTLRPVRRTDALDVPSEGPLLPSGTGALVRGTAQSSRACLPLRPSPPGSARSVAAATPSA